MVVKRFIHRGLAKLAARWPLISHHLLQSFRPRSSKGIPWQPLTKPLEKSKIALVTTAGLHHESQVPFDMIDSNGDSSFRLIDSQTIEKDYRITHDYFDCRDARNDLNVVFPIARLREMFEARCIGRVAAKHYSFMGHIDGPHVDRLIGETAPQMATFLKQEQVDAVVLTPA